ncbi:MAG: hypothetical protein JOZ51_05005 [Chloroflexi bacterium]|nr:hypothetical protein [Chloroflexota bacterium]
MKIADFQATTDLVGRRIRVIWDFVLEGADSLADIPRVTVRRKPRDFDYPADPRFLLYDSGAFPPADTVAADLPVWERRDENGRWLIAVETVRRTAGGQTIEVLRRTTTTFYSLNGLPTRRRVELLDTGDLLGGLQPATTYYYQLDPQTAGATPLQATALAGEHYGLGRTLYESLPAIYRRHDVVPRVVSADEETTGLKWVPEALPSAGQLRRFLDLFGTSLDMLRSSAEGLRSLHNLDQVDHRYLPLLAQWIGWDLSFDVGIPTQRNELSHAPRLYRGVGTAPILRAVNMRYADWETQIAEFAQSIARSNLSPQLNIFAQMETANGWRGIDDAALVLGFGPGNNSATGGANARARITGNQTQPFVLRPGLELLIAADNGTPEILRIGSADFAAITQATAAEVAAVINRDLANVTAEATAGQIVLRSDISGPASALQVLPASPSLISLEDAPRGRLSAFVDTGQRIRLFYATLEAPYETRIHYKSFIAGQWTDSRALTLPIDGSHGEPAAVELANGDVLLAWIEQPHTSTSRIRFARGTVQPLLPAQVVGQRRGPFAGLVGKQLVLRGNWSGSDVVTFANGDFANPASATAAEVATAITNRAAHADASALANGTISINSSDTGPSASLTVDGRQSSAAIPLGFGSGFVRARGAWNDAITWQAAGDVLAAQGRYADLHAVRAADGSVFLFWAEFNRGSWVIRSARWNGTTWAAPELRASGNAAREPHATLDATGRIWLVWSQLVAANDTWTLQASIFTPATNTWSAAAQVVAPQAGRSADREPALLRLSNGSLRLFFRSDRGGGNDLWSLTIDPTQTNPANWVTIPTATLGAGPASDVWPAPLLIANQLWLLFRSDRSVDLARATPTPATTVGGPATFSGTLRRNAGTTTPILADAQRNNRRRQWDDLNAYTPNRPLGRRDGPLHDDEWYSRGTIGVFVGGVNANDPAIQQQVVRMRQFLPRFLPLNARAVIILPPP